MSKKLLPILLLPLPLFATNLSFHLPAKNQHVTYRAMTIQNNTALPQSLSSLKLDALNAGVESCTADSSCISQYQNTCHTGTVLAPQASCLVWFHAKQAEQFAHTTEQTLTISVNEQQQQIKLTSTSQLFAAGDFTEPASHIARWDGKQWHSVGKGLTGESVQSLVEYQGDIIAGGDFYEADTHFVNFLARWNGSEWHSVADGVGDPGPSTLAVYADSLWVGGGFDQVGGYADARYLGSFFDERWAGYETYLDMPIQTLTVAGLELYAGGHFNEPVNHIGMWNHSQFTALGDGLNDTVLTLAGTPEGKLYAGGGFNASGDTTLNHIGLWDGKIWYPLGDGFNSAVQALSVAGNQLYAGGNTIARWDGSDWHPLAGGLAWERNPQFTRIYSIASLHDDVFVGGYFTQAKNSANTITTNNIAHWNETNQTWQALSNGLDGSVNSILIVLMLEIELINS